MTSFARGLEIRAPSKVFFKLVLIDRTFQQFGDVLLCYRRNGVKFALETQHFVLREGIAVIQAWKYTEVGHDPRCPWSWPWCPFKSCP